jgi:hypothetical protein
MANRAREMIMQTAQGGFDRENQRSQFGLSDALIRAERLEAFDAIIPRMALHKELGTLVWLNRDGLSDSAVLLLLSGVFL